MQWLTVCGISQQTSVWRDSFQISREKYFIDADHFSFKSVTCNNKPVAYNMDCFLDKLTHNTFNYKRNYMWPRLNDFGIICFLVVFQNGRLCAGFSYELNWILTDYKAQAEHIKRKTTERSWYLFLRSPLLKDDG